MNVGAMAAALLALSMTAPIVEAVKQKDLAAVRALVSQGVDVNAPEGDGATALHWAAHRDDGEMVDVLLGAGANVNAVNDLLITPLYLASANGNAAIIRTLLARGADPNTASETGVTPLMQAARSGSVEGVRALLARGAHVNAHERDRDQTALMWAVARRHPAVVKVLLDQGADVRARTRVRQVMVMRDQGPRRTVKTSMRDASRLDAGGTTSLALAAQADDAESARLLLAAGADVNDTTADGRSPLVIAAFAGHAATAGVLIEGGADLDATGAGYTALHAATLRGDLATVSALLAKGASPDARLTQGSPVRRFGSQWALPSTMAGGTPLLVAATYLEVEIVRALIAAGANPALGLPNGTTPLLAAAGAPIEKEARPSDLVRWNIVDSDAPLIPRPEADVLEAVKLLLDAGAVIEDVNEAGDTALHAAAASGMTRVIQLLADRGAALDVKNKNGQTPLSLTLPRGSPQEGRAPGPPGSKAAEELLRRLGATP
ncbi:MAG: ankyrin repeat domain-containing protein [Acidobacteriota bacterium]